MKRLILTGLHGMKLARTDLAELTIPFMFRFGWGELPSPDELASYVAARSEGHGPGAHWSDYVGRWRDAKDRKDLSLVEFCEPYERIELWFDPSPMDQLQLIWLLDYLDVYPDIVARLTLRLVDYSLLSADEEELVRWKMSGVAVTEAELETASLSWQAYRARTPEACFGLLSRDLSALPLLRPALVDLLEELPGTTGLGATEMRLLELVARGYQHPNTLFHHRGLRRTRVFSEFELGYLLDGLAHGPMPALAGLDETRTLGRENLRDRVPAHQRCLLSITEFGRCVLECKEDFSRHNPIDRWWGGTHLTSDQMWRWNPTLIKP